MLSKNELRELEESRMTPKKLLAIAEQLAECATDNPMWRKFGYVAGYVLANVREDDNDPVTPERLVELGGEIDKDDEDGGPFKHVWFDIGGDGEREALVTFRSSEGQLRLYSWASPREIENWPHPRNMKEARGLLVRCGAIKEEK